MIKANVIDKSGKEIRQIELPEEFNGNIREDILLKVFEAKKYKQPYGADPFAGKLYSASGILIRKRHAWKSSYGRAISRSPRKIMSRNGSNFNWVGATATYTRGGRRSHLPTSEENQFKKINKKEFDLAFISSLSGTSKKDLIEKRFNVKISLKLPIIIDSEVLKSKSKEFLLLIKNIYGSCDKILKQKKVRAGIGKMRGRKYKTNSGLLVVIGNTEEFKMGGITIKKAKDIEINDLSPNGEVGRLVMYTEKAITDLRRKK